MIAKVFRQADTEETGHVDVSYINDLAAGVLGGQNIKESEKALIKFHADSKKGVHSKTSCLYSLIVLVAHGIGQSTVSFAEFLELMGEILSETTRWGGLSTKLSGYVGFDTIQEQIRKKSLKRGFEFNLMVVGTKKNDGNDYFCGFLGCIIMVFMSV